MSESPVRSAHVLDAGEIIKTIDRLRARIGERFPGSGLTRVCGELLATAQATTARVHALARPYYGLRFLALLAVLVGIVLQIYIVGAIDWRFILRRADAVSVTQGLDATVNLLLLACGAIWFLMTLELRLKRRRVLRHLFEFRSFAHVIDMHQLTKDPTIIANVSIATPSSPQRPMSEFELSRYLHYCAEMLALTAKLAALYAGSIEDGEVVAAVNEIEELTSDLGRKIWQKIMIISQLYEARVMTENPAP